MTYRSTDLQVVCPTCKAAKGRRCIRRSSDRGGPESQQKRATAPHRDRRMLADATYPPASRTEELSTAQRALLVRRLLRHHSPDVVSDEIADGTSL